MTFKGSHAAVVIDPTDIHSVGPSAAPDKASKSSFAPSTQPPPPPGLLKNKLDEEPNPFEQSFSGKSESTSDDGAGLKSSGGGRGTGTGVAGGSGSHRPGPGGENHGSGDGRSLPSVSELTTPTNNEDEPFNWNLNTPSLESSLRNGPLSPAMLAGPKAAQAALIGHALNFNPTDFVRTGLTPGTGLTPLSGGPTSFPPPSPSTAAFLAMVTNATASANGNGAGPSEDDPLAMTPGTFNGVMNHLAQQNGLVPNNPSQPLSMSQNDPPDYFSRRPTAEHLPTHMQQSMMQQHDQQPMYPPHSTSQNVLLQQAQQQQQMHHQQMQQMHQMNYPLPHHQPPQQQHYHQPGPPDHYIKQGQAAASQAANGLFLLSQAHQEIAKRDAGSAFDHVRGGQKSNVQPPAGGAPPPPPAVPVSAAPSRGSKRKSSGSVSNDSPAAPTPPRKAARAAPKGRGKKAMSIESDDMGMNEVSPEPERADGLGADGKPLTEEEKRKNFLERNRQAALKCRQRKKAWLSQLQAKVEFLQGENDGLLQTVNTLRDEVSRLQTALAANGSLPPSVAAPVGGGGGGERF